MIYLDTSVVLAHLFVEDRVPRAALWREPLVSSRLLEYEVWTRLHSRRIEEAAIDAARETLGRIALLDLSRELVGRVLEPFPAPMRTLDALHLASMQFLADQGVALQLASYDERMRAGARALGFRLFRLD